MKPKKKVLKSPPVSTSKVYRAHRERQRRRILDAAQELFNERGIDRVTIAEIVDATGIRPTTLYEYFSNKDAVVWALVEEYQTQFSSDVQKHIESVSGSALAKITAIFDAFADELSKHPERARFQAQFDAMYAHEWSAEKMIAVLDRISQSRAADLSDLIREGIADGSLRPDLNPGFTLSSVLNAVIATQRRFAALGSRVEKEYGEPTTVLFREAVRIILLGLRRN